METEMDLNPATQSTAGGSPDRFGFEWNRYSEIDPRYEEQFLRWMPHFSKADWKGKRFLDVGCGMGRNSYWPLSYDAASSKSIDVDDRSLAAARRTLAPFPQAEVLQCSAYEIPDESSFDVVFSIGVLHHLEFPERALDRMVRAAKPGGRVAIWVYGRENNGWMLWVLDPARKVVFSKLPVGFVHFLSLFPTVGLWLALRLGLSQIEYFRLIRTFSFSHLRSIVFDQMLPRISNYWRRDEVERMMRDAGLHNIALQWVNEMSWAAIGTKNPVVSESFAKGPHKDSIGGTRE